MEQLKTKYFVRLNEIELRNFRNIEYGKVSFPNADYKAYLAEEPSVLGLYGQNGSGKTSVIMSLEILQTLLSGNSLTRQYDSCVRRGCDKCCLKYTFTLYPKLYLDDEAMNQLPDMPYLIEYSFEIEKKEEFDEDAQTTNTRLYIINEAIYCSQRRDEKIEIKKQAFFDTKQGGKTRAFGPKTKFDLFCLWDKENREKLADAKTIAMAESKSFLFCKTMLDILRENVVFIADMEEIQTVTKKGINALKSNTDLFDVEMGAFTKDELEAGAVLAFYSVFYIVLTNLRLYGRTYLHVLDTSIMGQTSVNEELPMMIWGKYKEGGVYSVNIGIKMDGATTISEKNYELVGTALHNIGMVLSKVIPGMALSLHDCGKAVNEKNAEIHRFEIISKRNGVEIPLKYESDGIRRIVSIMSLLIAAYNDKSFTIAIDEFDSGVFEYLLGEIIAIMADSMKGQLIFTSHNLRPLEVLPSKYLCFTTNNPARRFTTLSKRGNSNLRDCYFRNIVLGNDRECVYSPTDRYEIEMALHMAGEDAYE